VVRALNIVQNEQALFGVTCNLGRRGIDRLGPRLWQAMTKKRRDPANDGIVQLVPLLFAGKNASRS
jgi:hypothetical protein